MDTNWDDDFKTRLDEFGVKLTRLSREYGIAFKEAHEIMDLSEPVLTHTGATEGVEGEVKLNQFQWAADAQCYSYHPGDIQ